MASQGVARGGQLALWDYAGDPATFAGAALVLMGIAALAGYVPARRLRGSIR